MATAPVSLKQLAESKTEGIQKATYFKVHPSLIKFEAGFNLRTEGDDLTAHINGLAEAMEAGAVVPPIDVSVVDGEIIVRDGHCRTRAALLLLDKGIEYMLEARQIRGNEADAVFHMVGAGGGKHYSPLEQGMGFARLVAYGKSINEIAARLGMHRTTIENGLALAEAPVAVQQMVSSGQVASHLALKTVRQLGKGATGVLQEAVKVAKAAGKTKATAKHVAPKPEAIPSKGPNVIADIAMQQHPLHIAIGVDLDKIAEMYSLARVDGETDEALRSRLYTILRVHASIPAPLDDMTADAIALRTENAKLRALAESLALVNIVVSTLDRDAIVQLVQIARNLTK